MSNYVSWVVQLRAGMNFCILSGTQKKAPAIPTSQIRALAALIMRSPRSPLRGEADTPHPREARIATPQCVRIVRPLG